MFGSNEKTKIDNFSEVAKLLTKEGATGLTATQKKVILAIAEKVTTQRPETYSALLELFSKKKAAPRKKAPKKAPMSATKLDAILSELSELSKDRSGFEAKVDALNRAHSAPELKKIAAGFAAGARPKTKPEAVRILKAERNDRSRASIKADEAGNARPW